MPSPDTPEEDLDRLKQALRSISKREPLPGIRFAARKPEKACTIRQAMLSPREEVSVEQAEGRILADPCAGCPPAVPVLIAGERIDAEAVRCFRYYGTETCMVMK
jgi:arginine/lysine/ornithine decarboxylase